MDDMMSRWKSLAITEEEEDVVGLDDEDIAQGKAEMCHGLLGRLLTRKPFNRRTFREMITFPMGCERDENTVSVSGDGSSRRNWKRLARLAKGSGLAAFELSNLKTTMEVMERRLAWHVEMLLILENWWRLRSNPAGKYELPKLERSQV